MTTDKRPPRSRRVGISSRAKAAIVGVPQVAKAHRGQSGRAIVSVATITKRRAR